MRSLVSIFIPTKNAGNEFRKVLESIFHQHYKNFEVIIVDSGSKDNTLNMVRNFKVKLHQIKPEYFGHGKTRNLALKYCKGRYIVFLSQDACPFNEFWLTNLIKDFNNKKVVGVFSRQIPRKDARETEKYFYRYHFSSFKRIRSKKEYAHNIVDAIFFSNVSSCVRKDIFRRYPFDENLIMSEDQQFARDVLSAGYITIYEPSSIVVHSHNYNFLQTFRRYFDSAFSLQVITGGRFRNFTKVGANYMLSESYSILKKNPFLLPYLFFNNLAKVLGTYFGLNQAKLPILVKRTFSMHDYYWKV